MRTDSEVVQAYYASQQQYSARESIGRVRGKPIVSMRNASPKGFVVDPQLVASNAASVAWPVREGYRDAAIVVDRATLGARRYRLPGEVDEEGFVFHIITWRNDHLLLIYRGDHHLYICTIHDLRVSHIAVHGESYRLLPEAVTFQEYGRDAAVDRYSIPQLQPIDRLSEEEARALGIFPLSVDDPMHEQHVP